ncbi:MAG: M28 family peptidase [Chloroflexi bacterium]|nr:M28 family peptidase [Chloroflexota bacterium]
MWTAEEPYSPPDDALLRAVEGWLERFPPDRLRELVTSLPGPRSRLHAPEAMAATDELVSDAWRAAGWRVGRQRIRWRRVKGSLDHVPPGVLPGARRPRWHTYENLAGTNLVAIAEGETDEAVVLVAHHDTVLGSPGADDNGAALAMLLELAAQLRDRRFRRTVILAAPDFEEIGLLGSRPLVRWLRAAYDVRAAVVFDPIGFMDARPGTQTVPAGIDRLYPAQVRRLRERKRRGDTVVAIYRRRSTELVRRWSRCLVATIGPDRVLQLRDPLDLPLAGPPLALHPAARNFSRSDHVNFWRAGLPAIHVTNTGNFRNPHYHQPSDTPGTLDYDTLARIAAATALLIEDLAEPR